MKFIKAIFSALKKCFEFFASMFKDKAANEIVSDVTKCVTGAALAGITIKTAFDSIKVHSIRGVENTDETIESPADYLMKKRTGEGYIGDRLNDLRTKTRNLGKKNIKENANLDKGGSSLLQRIAKTRNQYFQSLSEKDQLDVLRAEGFDCKAFLAEEEKKRRGFFTRIWKKITNADRPMVIPGDEAVLKNEYSYLCFTDKIRHFFNLEPKHEVPQIKLFPEWHIADMTCETIPDLVQYARIACQYMPKSDIDTYVHSEGVSRETSLEEHQIVADELFKAKTYKKFKKRVNTRMSESGINPTRSVFEMMTDYEKSEKKKKKDKKKGKKNKKDTYIGGSQIVFDYDDGKDKKSKKKDKKKNKTKDKNKDGMTTSNSYAKAAKNLYQSYLEVDRKGGMDYEGKWM